MKVTDDPRLKAWRYKVTSIGFGGMVTLESLQNPGTRVKKSVSSLKRVSES
ncbi:hypothetical protein [[Phormidium ambiguum] IAM M-71]|uniref:hypothetical protein n=1 Tax=[Phormidium ambiguum] IAM M-71 TaxID=454136 RepID=UPI0015BE5620|nr:hypothetical protein [Phormidium ambiguum]